MGVKKDHSVGEGTGAAAGAVTGAVVGSAGGPAGALAGATMSFRSRTASASLASRRRRSTWSIPITVCSTRSAPSTTTSRISCTSSTSFPDAIRRLHASVAVVTARVGAD